VERFESGQVEPREFFEQFRRTLDLELEYDHFCSIWSSIFTHALLPESMLEGLARRYRLVLLSNTNAIHFDMIRQSYGHLLRHFDDLVLSYEVGAMKPRQEIFEAAIACAQCLPGECFLYRRYRAVYRSGGGARDRRGAVRIARAVGAGNARARDRVGIECSHITKPHAKTTAAPAPVRRASAGTEVRPCKSPYAQRRYRRPGARTGRSGH